MHLLALELTVLQQQSDLCSILYHVCCHLALQIVNYIKFATSQ
jgi:hypothetical protein